MIDNRALPGFALGVLGLVCAAVGLYLEAIWLVATAGLCALLAGLFTLRIAQSTQNLRVANQEMRSKISRATAESDAMAARAARFEAEALTTRRSLAEATADLMATADNMQLERMTDSETGLFNQTFFRVSLDKRVAAARRGLRPLAAVVLEVVTEATSDGPQQFDPERVSNALLETLRDADTACRLDDGRYAMILEDTPENGAVWTVERIRRRLGEQGDGQTLWAGVACYPAHAFDAVKIMEQAEAALVTARDWRQDRIEVAAPPLD